LSSLRTQIGRYRLDGVIGRGGMALVYLAHDAELGRPVAIKLLADNLAADESFRARFMREARMAAGLSHVNIVHVYDIGQDIDERPYIVMEYVDGESLDETLAREGRLPAARVREIALDCCAGLQHAHSAGLVHRDIKPHNLLVDREGSVKIADFGVARSLSDPQLTQAGIVLGSARYLSPEQAAGQPVTPSADIYSLGATLYELLTGDAPHAGESLTEMLDHGRRLPPAPIAELVPDVPAPFATAVMSCLEGDPGLRPQSASALADMLTAGGSTAATLILESQRPTSAGTLVLRRPLGLPRPQLTDLRRRIEPVMRDLFGRERRARAIGLAIGLLVVLVLVLAFATGGGSAPQPKPAAAHRKAVAPVPGGATPAADAHNLAAWIREHSVGGG
jgi:eukaryotic-like serine/threonine-protein kinase